MQRQLLGYLAEKSLGGGADQLKEYIIGIDAFGKPPTYDPRKDSTVRIQAGKLRLKLREYYAVEGQADPVAVDLPKGHFKLTFERREPTAAVGAAQPRRARPWLPAALFIALAAAACYGVFTTISLKRLQDRTAAVTGVWTPELEAIWQPFLSRQRPVIICIGTPLVVKFWPQVWPKMNVRSAVVNTWEEAQNSEPVEALKKTLRSPEITPNYDFTGIGEASGAFQLAALMGTRRQDLVLKRSSMIAWDDISRSDVIFLGPSKFNLPLKDVPVEQDLVLEGNLIRNLRPNAGEPASLPVGNWPAGAKTVEDHVLITNIPGPGGRGHILTFATAASAGTQAAVQYLTEAHYARDLVARLRLPSGELPPYYQIVIKAKFNSSIPVQASYLFHHVLRAR
jgi:hypothetical protein